MKLKLALISSLMAMASVAQAAVFVVSNVGTGYGDADRLLARESGALLTGGIVALGTFTGDAPSGDLNLIATTISNFNLLTSVASGNINTTWGIAIPGYVQGSGNSSLVGNAFGKLTTASPILTTDPLFGLGLYMFVGNGTNLADSTEWGLVKVNTIKSDNPNNNTYTAQPFGITPIIGTIGSATQISQESGVNETYSTLKLESAALIPEPSTAILGAIGALGLLRRRRI